jgi:hypothetical protein
MVGLAVTAAVVATTVNVVRRRQRVDRYDWLAERSAPRFCPIIISSSSFHYRGGGTLYIPPGALINDHPSAAWGRCSDVDVVGPDLKRLPDSFDVTYYSAVEDKLYQGEFQLPYEKTAKLFKDGYQELQSPQKAHTSYQRIMAGMAPGGEVAVWLAGVGRQTEVFFGRAAESNADWNDALRLPPHVTRPSRRESLLARTKDNPNARQCMDRAAAGGWARLHKRYAWRAVLENIDLPSFLYGVEYYNGELDDIRIPEAQSPEGGRAIPSEFTYYFTREMNQKMIRFAVKAMFDLDESLEVFERLAQEGGNIELVLRRDSPGQEATELIVRTEHRSVPLTKARLEVRPIGPPRWER